MENYKLVETFSEFKEFKNIDREAMMRIIEDVFRGMLNKKFDTDTEDFIDQLKKAKVESSSVVTIKCPSI